MKESISNNIGIKLIRGKGFSIIDTSSFPASTIKYSLYKEMWSTFHIVGFCDADVMNLNFQTGIKESIAREISAYKNAVGTIPIMYFKIFITQYGIPGDKINNILGCCEQSITAGAAFIPIILDLSSSRVLNPVPKMDKIGLTSLLTESFSEKGYYPGFDYLDEIFKNTTSVRQTNRSGTTRTNFKPYVTYSIIAVNILMFIITYLMEQSGDTYALVTLGAKVNELIVRGEYWRLFASAFLHSGIPHIAFNMFGLYQAGWMAERLYGGKKYIFIYLSSALVGSVSSFAFSNAVSVGASGAIFGLFGALLYVWRKKRRFFSTSFGINIIAVLLFNIIYGFTNSGIDNFAHLGGLVGGYISSSAAGLWDDDTRGISEKKILTYAALFFIFIGLLVYGIIENSPVH